ncbi:hypothetical protein [uncultured Helicobacter sp.]|nr:hypothetical protein [uncultured Helicobacter sp.]
MIFWVVKLFFARSYLSGSAEAKKANSQKSVQETTQNLKQRLVHLLRYR